MTQNQAKQRQTLPDNGHSPSSLDRSPDFTKKESNSTSFSEIFTNDLPRSFIKEPSSPIFKNRTFLEDNNDHLSFLSAQHKSASYRIQVKGASIEDIPMEVENKNGKLMHVGSSQFLLGAQLHAKLGREPIESDNDGSPVTGVSLKYVKSELLSPEVSTLSIGLSSVLQDKFSPDSVVKKVFSWENSKDQSAEDVKNISYDGVRNKLSTHQSDQSSGRRKWGKLRSVMHSLSLFQRQEVSMIQDPNSINDEMEKYSSQRIEVRSPKREEIYMKDNHTGEAFDLIRRVQIFCDCAAIGSPSHIKKMGRMLEEDPKKFMLEPNDSLHLLNRKNNNGWTPLYIAAKNGNLDVVKFLTEKKANHSIKSIRSSQEKSKEEFPLQAASKWGHSNVVEYLLKARDHDIDVINDCLKTASNAVVKALLKTHLDQRGVKKSIFKKLCRCWK